MIKIIIYLLLALVCLYGGSYSAETIPTWHWASLPNYIVSFFGFFLFIGLAIKESFDA